MERPRLAGCAASGAAGLRSLRRLLPSAQKPEAFHEVEAARRAAAEALAGVERLRDSACFVRWPAAPPGWRARRLGSECRTLLKYGTPERAGTAQAALAAGDFVPMPRVEARPGWPLPARAQPKGSETWLCRTSVATARKRLLAEPLVT